MIKDKDIARFRCNQHPQEILQYIDVSDRSDGLTILCKQCSNQADQNVFHCSKFFQSTKDIFDQIRKRPFPEEARVTHFNTFIQKKSELMKELEERLNNEKKLIDQSCDRVQVELQNVIENVKAELKLGLDQQIQVIESEYMNFQLKYKQFCDQSYRFECFPSSSTFESEIQKCKTILDYNNYVEQIKRDRNEYKEVLEIDKFGSAAREKILTQLMLKIEAFRVYQPWLLSPCFRFQPSSISNIRKELLSFLASVAGKDLWLPGNKRFDKSSSEIITNQQIRKAREQFSQRDPNTVNQFQQSSQQIQQQTQQTPAQIIKFGGSENQQSIQSIESSSQIGTVAQVFRPQAQTISQGGYKSLLPIASTSQKNTLFSANQEGQNKIQSDLGKISEVSNLSKATSSLDSGQSLPAKSEKSTSPDESSKNNQIEPRNPVLFGLKKQDTTIRQADDNPFLASFLANNKEKEKIKTDSDQIDQKDLFDKATGADINPSHKQHVPIFGQGLDPNVPTNIKPESEPNNVLPVSNEQFNVAKQEKGNVMLDNKGNSSLQNPETNKENSREVQSGILDATKPSSLTSENQKLKIQNDTEQIAENSKQIDNEKAMRQQESLPSISLSKAEENPNQIQNVEEESKSETEKKKLDNPNNGLDFKGIGDLAWNKFTSNKTDQSQNEIAVKEVDQSVFEHQRIE